MKQLETRFYSLDELAAAINRKRDSHFAANAKSDLTKWGYAYKWQSRRGVIITKRPEAATERLAELMNRKFGLNIQVNVEDFVHFLWLLLTEDGFDSMPWAEREEIIKQRFSKSATERTLRRWASALIRSDSLHKTQEKELWRTSCFDGKLFREPTDSENEFYLQYQARKSELLNTFQQQELSQNDAWSSTFKALWQEFQCCYYNCAKLTLNALEEELNEIIDLTTQICLPQLTEE